MGLDSCMKCLKYALFIFNFIFWLVGVVVLAFGLYLLINPLYRDDFFFHWPDELKNYLHIARLTLIVLGSVVMLLGFLGCCGSILENKCMLVVFFILMTLIFLALVTLGLLIVFMAKPFKDATIQEFNKQFLENIKNYKTDMEAKNETDAFQQKFSCCGAHNASDYKVLDQQIPDSCKKPGESNHHPEGCTEKLKMLEGHWFKVVIGLFTTALITLIGMVLAITLCCALRDDVYD